MLVIKFVTPQLLAQFQDIIADAKKLKSKLENREDLLQKVKEYMVERWQVNFTTEGSIYGKWKDLSPSWTVIERGSAHPILVRTGQHFASFVNQNEAGEVSNQAVTWNFENRPGEHSWLVAHHLGIPNPIPNRADIGPRLLWDVNEDDVNKITDILEEQIGVEIVTIFDRG